MRPFETPRQKHTLYQRDRRIGSSRRFRNVLKAGVGTRRRLFPYDCERLVALVRGFSRTSHRRAERGPVTAASTGAPLLRAHMRHQPALRIIGLDGASLTVDQRLLKVVPATHAGLK